MKTCLILGGASCVWDDLDAAWALAKLADPSLPGSMFYDVIVANWFATEYPGKLRAFATLHPENILRTMRVREAKGFPMGFSVYTTKDPGLPCDLPVHPLSDWAGSSGLYAVRVALHLGYTRIILAGVPMTETPHFDKTSNWTSVHFYRKGWTRHMEQLRAHVRSFSGWTRDQLGAPTVEWLN